MTDLRDKDFNAQLEEALVHTSEAEANRKGYFEKTAYDHIVVRGTPPDGRMWDNPNTSLLELKSIEELEQELEKFYSICNSYYTREAFEKNVREEINNSRIENKSSLASMAMTLARRDKLPKRYSGLVVQK